MPPPAPTIHFRQSFSSGGAPCAGIQPGAPTCPLAVSLNTFPSGTLKTPYYYQYNLGIEQQIGSRGDLRADFVGTRGVHEPYQVQLNGYQNVCNGCFAPFPYQQPLDQRFGNVNEFRTGCQQQLYRIADRLYAAMGRTDSARQLHPQPLSRRGIERRLARILDTGAESPLPGELSRQYASCDYDVRHNVSAFGLYQVPFHSSHAVLRQIFGGWSFSETAFLHSGLPFSVLSQPYIANGNGVFQANGARPSSSTRRLMPTGFRACRVSQDSYPGVTVAGTKQWLNPDAFVSVVDPATGACNRDGDFADNRELPVRQLRPQLGPRTALHEFRHLHHKMFPIREGIKFRIDAQMFNAFNHPNFALPKTVQAGVPGSTSEIRDARKARSPRLPDCLAWGSEETLRRA